VGPIGGADLVEREELDRPAESVADGAGEQAAAKACEDSVAVVLELHRLAAGRVVGVRVRSCPVRVVVPERSTAVAPGRYVGLLQQRRTCSGRKLVLVD
jgi:hypothetical protein